MKRKKKIKLKGSSFFDRNKPLNKPRKSKPLTPKEDRLSKRKPINRITKQKQTNHKENLRPYSNIQKNNTNPPRYLPDVIDKRYILSFSAIIARLTQLQLFQTEKYSEELVASTEKIIEGESTPRGRIYDRNHKLLVDNKAVKTIYYKKEPKITTKEEIELAYTLSKMLNIDYSKLSEKMLKTFWYVNNEEKAKSRITSEERKKKEERKLDSKDIENLIYERITPEDLSKYTEEDKKTAYIYYLMNKGYSYAEKILKNKDVTDDEYAYISENIDNLKGVNTKLDWERTYPYGDLFKSILGTVSSSTQGIPKELVDIYLQNGYSMNDRVGISYLEYQYEKYLKGTKAKYKITSGNHYELYEEGKRGNDIVLTIDIDLSPLTLIIEIAPIPNAVEIAAIVSFIFFHLLLLTIL